MASRPAARALSHLIRRCASRSYTALSSAPHLKAPLRSTTPRILCSPNTCLRQTRLLTTNEGTSTPYTFQDVQTLSESPAKDRKIIDVREPSELAQGFIPGAINIPIGSQPDALLLPADEFEDRFGFEKPAADTEVIFYCKAGVRSNAAAKLAQQAGWRRVGNYQGSWLDWVKNGGRIERA